MVVNTPDCLLLPAAAWFLEKVEVKLLSSSPAVRWEAHYRDWLQPLPQGQQAMQAAAQPQLLGYEEPMAPAVAEVVLQPDPLVWQEWDMQVGCGIGCKGGCSAQHHVNAL